MKLYRILLLSLLSILFTSCAFTGKKLKPVSSADLVYAEAGTLTNDDLVQNISQAITQVMGDPDKPIEKFIVQQPVGKKKAWREQWIFDPESSNEQFLITFRKDKKGFTDFEIQPMPPLKVENVETSDDGETEADG